VLGLYALNGGKLPLAEPGTEYVNSESVVLEIAKAVGLSLQNFHFGVANVRDPSFLVKRHMVAISSFQESRVLPRWRVVQKSGMQSRVSSQFPLLFGLENVPVPSRAMAATRRTRRWHRSRVHPREVQANGTS
jgi:hypothetical protein